MDGVPSKSAREFQWSDMNGVDADGLKDFMSEKNQVNLESTPEYLQVYRLSEELERLLNSFRPILAEVVRSSRNEHGKAQI